MAELPASLSPWLVLAALPLLLAACTAFTKISIVLAALRVGLGAERLLPIGSMLALALVVTGLIMAPIVEAIGAAIEQSGGLDLLVAAPLSVGPEVLHPLWGFLAEHADAAEIELFTELAARGADDPLVLIPAFLVSELGRGLSTAVMILLPFVAVDLIAGQVLVLIGQGQTPTAVVALPAKILLFVAADGWATVIVGLVEGYR